MHRIRSGITLVVDDVHSGNPEAGVAGVMRRRGYRVFYAENTLWLSLFGDTMIARMMPFGREEKLDRGTVLFCRGDRKNDFFLVLEGSIEIFEGDGERPQVLYAHRDHQFAGELDLFNDRQVLVADRVGSDSRLLRIEHNECRRMVATEANIGEIRSLTRADWDRSGETNQPQRRRPAKTCANVTF